MFCWARLSLIGGVADHFFWRCQKITVERFQNLKQVIVKLLLNSIFNIDNTVYQLVSCMVAKPVAETSRCQLVHCRHVNGDILTL